MSIITKLSSIFSKKQPTQTLAVSLQPECVGFCVFQADGTLSHIESVPIVSKTRLDIINEFLNEHKTLAGANTHVIINHGSYSLVQVEKPNVPETEISSALKWLVKDLVPIAPDNMVCDYFDIAGQQTQPERVNVVCAKKDELQALVEALLTHQLNIVEITIPEFCFAKLIPPTEDPVLLVCQQPAADITLLVAREGRLEFFRHLRGFTQIYEQSEQELTYGTIDSLSLEIQKSIDYYERQLKLPPVQKIALLLPIKTEAFLAEKIAENMHLPLTLAELPESMQSYRNLAVAYASVASAVPQPKTESDVEVSHE
jgi:MSHA biogenesis protein MshI